MNEKLPMFEGLMLYLIAESPTAKSFEQLQPNKTHTALLT